MGNIVDHARSKLTRDPKRKPTGAVAVERTNEAIFITVDLGEEGRKADLERAKIAGAFLVIWLGGLVFIAYHRHKPNEYPLAAAMGLFGAIVMLWRIRSSLRNARDPFSWRLMFTRDAVVGESSRRSGADRSKMTCPRDRIGKIAGEYDKYREDGRYELVIYSSESSTGPWRVLTASREVVEEAAEALREAVAQIDQLAPPASA